MGEGGVFVVMKDGVIFVDYMMVFVKVMCEFYEVVGVVGFGFVDVLILGG